jgi:thioredoxin-related protein
MRRIQFLFLAFVLTCTSLAGAQGITAKFDPQRDAAKDVAAAVSIAKAQGKHVMVDVGGEWCKWCHFLDKFIETTPEVKSTLDKNFVWVKVNWSPENKNVALLSQWPKIKGYPHLFVLDGEGKLQHSQDTGSLEAEEGKNTYDKQKVMAFINQQIAKK